MSYPNQDRKGIRYQIWQGRTRLFSENTLWPRPHALGSYGVFCRLVMYVFNLHICLPVSDGQACLCLGSTRQQVNL